MRTFFFGVGVFNPHAPSNSQITMALTDVMERKREYNEQKVTEIEYSTFTPLVLSAIKVQDIIQFTTKCHTVHKKWV